MSSLHLHPIAAFRDNYIWALHDDDGHCLVVDPGDAAPVIDWLEQQQYSLGAILVTHHHPDHVGGLAALLARWPVPVYGPDNEHISHISQRLADGDELTLTAPAVHFRVLAVPGHTLDHIAWFSDQTATPLLFCGDTLFSSGCGRLFEGTPAQMLRSLQRLATLPDDTLVCCAHEYTSANLAFSLAMLPDDPALHARQQQVQALRAREQPSLPVTLAAEKQHNLFLRCAEPMVQQSMIARGAEPDDVLSVFTVLRAEKDRF